MKYMHSITVKVGKAIPNLLSKTAPLCSMDGKYTVHITYMCVYATFPSKCKYGFQPILFAFYRVEDEKTVGSMRSFFLVLETFGMRWDSVMELCRDNENTNQSISSISSIPFLAARDID